MSDKFIAVDEEGYFVLQDGLRLTDPNEGRLLLQNLTINDHGTCFTKWGGDELVVEPFDKPLVAQQVQKIGNELQVIAPYDFTAPIKMSSFCLDTWDRFHGLTEKNIPFVLTRKAQAELFNLFDEFDDDSFTMDGKTFPTPLFYIENETLKGTSFWQQKYAADEPPRWDLNQHHPALEAILPQIKINKCRILNLGCGRGHDAAFLANLGHVVTGVDFSLVALAQAKTRYGEQTNLKWIHGDALGEKPFSPADLIFEHTLFCAISPTQRKKLVQQWKRSLDEQGHLLGIFYVHTQRNGPPWGASEWELRELLEKDFRLLYWKRWPLSPGHRHGTELVIYAQKK